MTLIKEERMKRRAVIKLGTASLLATTPIPYANAAEDELVVGVSLSGPPYAFRVSDDYDGFDIEFWKEMANGIGRKYRIQPAQFASLVPALQTRNIDVVSASMFIKPERQKVVDFSIPYYQSGLLAVTKADNSEINSTADLAGKTIGTETGTGAVDYIKTHVPSATILQLPDINSALLALNAGRTDAVVFDAPKLTLYAHGAGEGKVKVVYPLLDSLDIGLAMQKGSPLVQPINEQITKMKTDGRIAALKKKWFGE